MISFVTFMGGFACGAITIVVGIVTIIKMGFFSVMSEEEYQNHKNNKDE